MFQQTLLLHINWDWKISINSNLNQQQLVQEGPQKRNWEIVSPPTQLIPQNKVYSLCWMIIKYKLNYYTATILDSKQSLVWPCFNLVKYSRPHRSSLKIQSLRFMMSYLMSKIFKLVFWRVSWELWSILRTLVRPKPYQKSYQKQGLRRLLAYRELQDLVSLNHKIIKLSGKSKCGREQKKLNLRLI